MFRAGKYKHFKVHTAYWITFFINTVLMHKVFVCIKLYLYKENSIKKLEV